MCTCVQHKRQHVHSLVAFRLRSSGCRTTDLVMGRVTQAVRCTEREREWHFHWDRDGNISISAWRPQEAIISRPFLFARQCCWTFKVFFHSAVMSDSRGQACRVPARHRWCADVVLLGVGEGRNVKALCGVLSLCSSKRKLFIRTWRCSLCFKARPPGPGCGGRAAEPSAPPMPFREGESLAWPDGPEVEWGAVDHKSPADL